MCSFFGFRDDGLGEEVQSMLQRSPLTLGCWNKQLSYISCDNQHTSRGIGIRLGLYTLPTDKGEDT